MAGKTLTSYGWGNHKLISVPLDGGWGYIYSQKCFPKIQKVFPDISLNNLYLIYLRFNLLFFSYIVATLLI
jgi:hypothetical protein